MIISERDASEFTDATSAMQTSLQHRLLLLNHRRLGPAVPTAWCVEDLHQEMGLRSLEHYFVLGERVAVERRAATAPGDPVGFLAWFEELQRTGPGQNDPLFSWLSESATLQEVRWFLRQEVAGEAGFEDLLAWTQVKMPAGPKLEMARNFWDEMGRGREKAMHGPMLEYLARDLELPPSHDLQDVVWESLALANLLCALAANRHYAYHAVGALGVIELTAPGRAAAVDAALQRLGIDTTARRYYAVHATLDLEHSSAWNREVIVPLVEQDPSVAKWIAEGALMRLRAGARCFVRYRRELWS